MAPDPSIEQIAPDGSVSEPDAGHRSFWTGVSQIYRQMSSIRRHQLHVLLTLMLFNAIAELGTIGAVLPLLALIAHPETLQHYPWVLGGLHALGADSQSGRLIATTLIFAAFAIASGTLRFELTRVTFGFGYDLAHELTLEIQRRLLQQPYRFHVQRNTSRLISSLDKANIVVFDVGLPLIQAAIAAFISLFIIAILVIVEPLAAILAIVAFTLIYVLASVLTKARLAANSDIISRGIDERLKIAQESLGGIRDVLIDGSQSTYLAQFDRENSKLGRARANTAVISSAPRFLIETIGIVAIAAIALAASLSKGGFAAALPALGAVALGAQRLLPLIQQIYRGWATASGHLSVIGETVDLLRLPIDLESDSPTNDNALPLREKIVVRDLVFTYPNRPSPALSGISFEVPAGSSVALVGETGSGKSTLADLLMGLLDADSGSIEVDGVPLTRENGRRWQRSIAHVSQSIFLADDSIARNISLSVPDIPSDHERIVAAATKAQLHEFITSLPAGYDTRVGERGIRLSGGQRQRLGMARAIYKSVPILVLDEATSALDELTERAVIGAVDELRKTGNTIIIIAHRPSTIRHCDLVVRLNQGRLTELDRPKEAVSSLKMLS